MKIALAQINTTVGALQANSERILDAYARAADLGAELVVFPEMTLPGYPPRDLLEIPDFIRRNMAALESVASRMTGPGAIVGYAHAQGIDSVADLPEASREKVDSLEVARWMNAFHPSSKTVGKGLFNAAALIDGGHVISRHFKSLLPTYDVFDEGRHFDPATEVHPALFRGLRLGISICEDFWNHGFAVPRRLYVRDPIKELADQGVDLMINISASPYSFKKREIKTRLYQDAAVNHKIPLVVVNLVGGNDNLIFDGWSNVWTSEGNVALQAREFDEDLILWDSENSPNPAVVMGREDESTLYSALTLGLRDYLRKCGFQRVLIGLSGGIDSALVAVIAADALGPVNVVGVSMPSRFSSGHSCDDAAALARNLGIEYHTIPIGPIDDAFRAQLAPLFEGTPFGLAEENIQARARGNLLMALSNKFGWLVLATGNKSEMAVGYCTLYGDMSGGLAVLADVLKTQVYALARWVNREKERIPRSSIEKPPSAELRPDQLDSDSLPPYEVLDPIISAYVEDFAGPEEIIARGYDEATVRRVVRMIDRAEYKRQQAAVCLKVTAKAFGSGRRMPIARGE